jgi:drug/metabolite transporter (DMT)-like permease
MQLPRAYLLGCGVLFVSYMLMLFLGVGLARSHSQVLEVGLLNYLWPTLTILFSLVLLKKKARWLLLPGTLLALVGVFLVLTQGNSVAWTSLLNNLAGNPTAYSLGLAAAVSWALYSNLTRRWAADEQTGAVDVFLLATGLTLLILCLAMTGWGSWNHRAAGEAVVLGVATWAAYRCWDVAMRKGNVVLVAACAYFTPFFSTVISCLYLGVSATPRLWIGCMLITIGSLLSWMSVSDREEMGAGRT